MEALRRVRESLRTAKDVDRTRNARKKDGNDMVKRDDGDGGQGKEWKKEEWERDDARNDERCDEESGR